MDHQIGRLISALVEEQIMDNTVILFVSDVYKRQHIDPTKNTIEEDQIITSADELCAELFNEVATDVFQEAKREHFYPDADDDEIAVIRRRWQPYLDLLPEYRSSCRAFHIAE